MKYDAYGELAETPHVVVDGSAQRSTVLTLSHWPGAATPEALRRDLSAEIAFAYLDHPELHVDVEYVTNNHFDQDGLVGVFALTEPESALTRREHLIDVARAGDFSCFRERDAARAAIALANLAVATDGDAYESVLPQLLDVVDHVGRYRDHWESQDAHITETELATANGTIRIEERPELDLAIVTVPDSWHERVVQQFGTVASSAAHPYAVHNATDRFAVLTCSGTAPQIEYRYETWVHYVSRRPRPRVDLTALAAELTAEDNGSGTWTFDGVDALSPRLHLVGAHDTTVTAERFTQRVLDELAVARSTWSPYPD